MAWLLPRWRSGALALWTCATAASCGRSPAPAELRGLQRRSLVLGEQALSCALPEQAQVAADAVRANAIVIGFAPGTRINPTILLAVPNAADLAATFPSQIRLAGGATLRFDARPDVGGGSGGTESELTGLLAFADGPTVFVLCRNQGELPVPDPRWCIAYLHHLTPGHVRR